MGRPYIDLTGRQYDHITVLSVVENSGGTGRHKMWNCKCDCGKEFTVAGSHLTSGKVTQCRACANREAATKHGYSNDPLHRRWYGMIKRCYRENNNSYSHYGGRGITICDEWGAGDINDIEGFLRFRQWSVDHGFSPELEIDRIDVDGPYAPWNCRWIPKIDQRYNKTNTVSLTIDGITRPLMEWAKEVGIRAETVRARIKRGMDAKSALYTPV